MSDTITREDIDLWELEMAEWFEADHDTPTDDFLPPEDDDYDPHGEGEGDSDKGPLRCLVDHLIALAGLTTGLVILVLVLQVVGV